MYPFSGCGLASNPRWFNHFNAVFLTNDRWMERPLFEDVKYKFGFHVFSWKTYTLALPYRLATIGSSQTL
jgi:hypothetical protein